MPAPTHFNDEIGIVLIKDHEGTSFYFMNMVDLATRFQLMWGIRSKKPKSVLSFPALLGVLGGTSQFSDQ